MNLKGILAVSGQPGLFKMVSQAKNSIIVESLTTKKRMPAYASQKISALEDIAIYTYSDEIPLREIFQTIYKLQEGKNAPDHKSSANILKDFMLQVLPDYDKDRVYVSDIKKLFQWYNLLNELNMIDLETEDEEAAKDGEVDSEVETEEKEDEKEK